MIGPAKGWSSPPPSVFPAWIASSSRCCAAGWGPSPRVIRASSKRPGRSTPSCVSIRKAPFKADHLLTPHRRETGEKLVNGLAAFEIVHQVLYRHPGSGEHGSFTHDLGIRVEDFGQIAFTPA